MNNETLAKTQRNNVCLVIKRRKLSNLQTFQKLISTP